jgi:hypothetical protein
MKVEELAASFGVDVDVLVEAIRLSPNAQGYIRGAISELMIKRELQEQGFELQRIKEKWEGKKLHFGDYYISKRGKEKWYVLESKGLKSNSEKWHNLTSIKGLTRFLKKYNKKLKLFKTEKELLSWVSKYHTKNLERLKGRVRVLETHLVSGQKTAGRTIHTPKRDEFDYVSFDLFLRTGRREFIFADPDDLKPSKGHKGHIKQNYVIDILPKGVRARPVIRPPWHRTLAEIWDNKKKPVKPAQMQVDTRANK